MRFRCVCLFVRSLCHVENAAGKEINDSSLARHHFYFKSKIDTDNKAGGGEAGVEVFVASSTCVA